VLTGARGTTGAAVLFAVPVPKKIRQERANASAQTCALNCSNALTLAGVVPARSAEPDPAEIPAMATLYVPPYCRAEADRAMFERLSGAGF
jgi:hypothetical protein